MNLAAEIKEYALNIGFCKAGITTADDFDDFTAELSTRGSSYEHWEKKFALGASPKSIMPEAKSIIVVAYDYAQKSFPEKLLPMIGRAYLARCYYPLKSSVCGARLELLAEFLRNKGLRVMADPNPLILRPAAARAGVATFGRNNFAYVDGVGSFVILYGFIVDKELDHDEPTLKNKCPPSCRACVDACPTKALCEPFKLEPSKCIGCNNWARHPGKFGTTVPRELRSQLGQHIHGCDICQEACPRNRAKLTANYPKDEFLELIAERFSLRELLHLSDSFYEESVYPIMYNYIKDRACFQRNAAIAIGNLHDESYIPDLEEELSNPSEMVRIHVAWALAEVAGEKARDILINHAMTEESAAVLEEIRDILECCGKRHQ